MESKVCMHLEGTFMFSATHNNAPYAKGGTSKETFKRVEKKTFT